MRQAKRRWRARLREQIAALSLPARQQASARLCAHLLAWDRAQTSRTILAYAALADEPDLTTAIQAWLDAGLCVCLPRMDWAAGTMEPVQITTAAHGLEVRRHGIREPAAGGLVVALAEVDLVLVPGVGFDRTGNRLGRGAGFYDRFLVRPGLRACRCGVAFAVQLVEHIPAGPDDVRMDAIATEDGVVLAGTGPAADNKT